jgi:transposase InsO family protein
VIPRWAVEELAGRVRGVKDPAQRGGMVDRAAKEYGVSRATVYRKLAAHDGKKGSLRITAEERAWALEIAGYLKLTMNQKGIAPSTETAIRELTRMGKLPAAGCEGMKGLREGGREARGRDEGSEGGRDRGQGKDEGIEGGRERGRTEGGADIADCRVQTANRKVGDGGGDGGYCISRQRADVVLAALSLTKRHIRAGRPCVRLLSPGPNTWGQCDATVASAFYLENMRVGLASEYEKNPREKTKLLLCCYVDHYSGCIFARAYEAQGESTALMVRFLYDAWRDKGDPGFPMHGVPWNVYTDQGPAWKSKPMQTLFSHMFVTWHGHAPGNARATGSVERRFLDTARFEAMLRGRLAFGHHVELAEFNSWLYEWCVDQNNRQCTTIAGKTRFEAWSSIAEDEIRQVPKWETYLNLTAVGEMRRKVSPYMSVSLDGREYFVGAPDLVGEYVDVYRAVDGKVHVKNGNEIIGPLNPDVPANVLGVEGRRAPLSRGEKNLREAVAAAEEMGMRRQDIAYVRGGESDIFIPRPGRKMRVQPVVGRRPAVAAKTELAAKDWLAQRFGSLSELDWEVLVRLEGTIRELLGENGEVTEDELAAMLGLLEEARQKTVRLAPEVEALRTLGAEGSEQDGR